MNFNGGIFVCIFGLNVIIFGLLFYGVILDNFYLMMIYIFEYDGFVDFLWYLFNVLFDINVVFGIFMVYIMYVDFILV